MKPSREMEDKNKMQLPHDVSNDRKIESFLYLYFLVSIGFILSIMHFISSYTNILMQRHLDVYLDLYCCCCIALSILWMLFMLIRQQKSTTVKFMDLPKRYTRPLLIAAYVFGISCVVTDTITLWTLVGCYKTSYIQFLLCFFKVSFVIVLMLFSKKYSTASLFDASIGTFHVLATCVCLMLRTVLGNSRQLIPSSIWTSSNNCSALFTNPLIEENNSYIIAFDQEFNVIIIVIFLVIWTNIKSCTKQQSKTFDFTYEFIEDKSNTSRDTSLDTEVIHEYQPSHSSLNEAVQKEPNVDVGLVFGLTIGAILSIPYTFWWERSSFTDKKVELYIFHMIFIVSMFLATIISFVKLTNFPIPRLMGINFPVTVLLFLLLFCCTWHSWLSTLAFGAELQQPSISLYHKLAFSDHLLFSLQVIFQTCFIVKAYSYCSVVLKPKSSNIIRQCVLFLMVCNFVLWLHLIYFDLNHKEYSEIQSNFYGHRIWNIINKTTFPLCMFYRLFSSLCLFEICFLF